MSTKSREAIDVPALTRRAFVCAGASVPLLTACSSDPNSDTAGIVGMVRQSVEGIGGPSSITREQAGAVPFASIGVRLGDSGENLLALATKARAICLWTSAARIAIETQSGRITRTAGFAHNMSQAIVSGSDPLQSGVNGVSVCGFAIDLPDRNVYQAPIRYEMKAAGRDETMILGGTLKVIHVLEHASCPLLNWEFENEYWIDPASSFVWRSKQNIHPDLDTVEIEVFRPPA